ncbi:MAG: hypothetical protein K6G64_04840 [Eubacterium sp.]|nr:hypothetical protein [Eubacterium sp.]
MRKFAKKFAAAALSLSLVFAVSTTCFGETWGSYFGADQDWYEGASGSLANANAVTAFTANLETVGWGGVWGAQVFLTPETKLVNVKKGEKYTVNFKIKSSNVNKYVYVKIATGEVLAHSFWVKVPAGTSGKTVKETFTAKANANTVYFGLGGDVGNREDVSTDEDAAIRYSVFDKQFKEDHAVVLADDANGDYTSATAINVTNFSILPTVKFSAKSKKAKRVTVKVKKAKTGIVKSVGGYVVKVGKKTVKKNKTTITVKNKKFKSGKKVKVQVRVMDKSKKFYGPWSKAKKVKVK